VQGAGCKGKNLECRTENDERCPGVYFDIRDSPFDVRDSLAVLSTFRAFAPSNGE